MKTFEEYQYRFSIPHNKVRGYKYSPKNKKELIEAIKAEIKLQGNEANLNMIDTSQITDMSRLFYFMKDFNGDVSQWDVSSVTDMEYMFIFCESFDCDISKWDVSRVTNMSWMFEECNKFNRDLSRWDVSCVKYTYRMFACCPIKEEYKPKFK